MTAEAVLNPQQIWTIKQETGEQLGLLPQRPTSLRAARPYLSQTPLPKISGREFKIAEAKEATVGGGALVLRRAEATQKKPSFPESEEIFEETTQPLTRDEWEVTPLYEPIPNTVGPEGGPQWRLVRPGVLKRVVQKERIVRRVRKTVDLTGDYEFKAPEAEPIIKLEKTLETDMNTASARTNILSKAIAEEIVDLTAMDVALAPVPVKPEVKKEVNEALDFMDLLKRTNDDLMKLLDGMGRELASTQAQRDDISRQLLEKDYMLRGVGEAWRATAEQGQQLNAILQQQEKDLQVLYAKAQEGQIFEGEYLRAVEEIKARVAQRELLADKYNQLELEHNRLQSELSHAQFAFSQREQQWQRILTEKDNELKTQTTRLIQQMNTDNNAAKRTIQALREQVNATVQAATVPLTLGQRFQATSRPVQLGTPLRAEPPRPPPPTPPPPSIPPPTAPAPKKGTPYLPE